ncbi:MAG: hypothetical protein AB7R69_00710 [Candidatus Babeliales bacterium]
MKRLLSLICITLLLTNFALELNAVATVTYNAVFINPAQQKGLERTEGGRIPYFVNAARVGRINFPKIGNRIVVETTVDLMKAVGFAQNPDYSIAAQVGHDHQDTVFNVCIKKELLPGFEPSNPYNVYGFKSFASAKEMTKNNEKYWCFELKEGQGYTKVNK